MSGRLCSCESSSVQPPLLVMKLRPQIFILLVAIKVLNQYLSLRYELLLRSTDDREAPQQPTAIKRRQTTSG